MTNPENQPTVDQQEDDLAPEDTPGYKVGAKKTMEEYANMDAGDESLQRWKASLGLGADAASKGKCQVIIRELALETEGRPDVVLDMSSPEAITALVKTPLVVKEGIEYCIKVKFDVQNDVVSGLKYIQSVSRLGISLKSQEMLGSYGPAAESYTKNFPKDEMPSGMLQRGEYTVKSRFVDDDKNVYLDLAWKIVVKKNWE